MSKIQPKRAYLKEILERFSGMSANGSQQASVIGTPINFRVAADGSLEKRNGWRLMQEFSRPLRGAYTLEIDGITLIITLYGSTFYLYVEGEGGFEVPSEIPDADTPVQFFMFCNNIYLLDGQDIYMLGQETFEKAVGYVPLYGLGWHPSSLGEVCEEPNVLTPKIRINYYNPDHLKVIYLPFYSKKIDCLCVDGQEVTDFTYGNSSKVLILSTTGTEIDVAFTYYRNDAYTNALQQSDLVFCDELGNEPTMFLGGAQTETPLLLVGTNVSEARHSGSLLYYPESTPLYFLQENAIPFGSWLEPMTELYRNDSNRFLAFTTQHTYAITYNAAEKALNAMLLSDNMGCIPTGLHASIDGDPLILNRAGLFRVRLNSQNMLEQEQIPCPYPELLATGFAENAIIWKNLADNEIWLRDATEADGTVLVYNTLKKEWYRFKGIHAQKFFAYGTNVGVCCQNCLGAFLPDQYSDGGQPIEAEYTTEFLDFGEPETPKRALRLSLTAETDGESVDVDLETESRTRNFAFVGKGGTAPDHFDARAAMGRFRHLRVRIRSNTSNRFRIKRLALFANL